MQLTAEQIAKLTTENGEAFATLAHFSAESVSLVFADNSMEALTLDGDKLAETVVGTRVFFGADGKITRTGAPVYKAPAQKQGQGSTAMRPNL
jgi:hypothetical protein